MFALWSRMEVGVLLSPSSEQSDATRPSREEVLEDLEERVFKDRPANPQRQNDSPPAEKPAA